MCRVECKVFRWSRNRFSAGYFERFPPLAGGAPWVVAPGDLRTLLAPFVDGAVTRPVLSLSSISVRGSRGLAPRCLRAASVLPATGLVSFPGEECDLGDSWSGSLFDRAVVFDLAIGPGCTLRSLMRVFCDHS